VPVGAPHDEEDLMDIGIIGSGIVAQTVGGKLLELSHSVMVSSRDVDARKERHFGVLPAAQEWAAAGRAQGLAAAAGSFAEAAAHGELVINATAGAGALEALASAGAERLRGKILVDLTNPLDHRHGMPPTLLYCNTESLGEKIQAAFPETKVVKALNTVNCEVMIAPDRLPEETDLFIAGNDSEAKEWVRRHLLEEWLGWRRVIDLGDITNARGPEMYLPLWLRLWGATGTGILNVRVVTE
jgi:predicted dinucleotide-binding enzyme